MYCMPFYLMAGHKRRHKGGRELRMFRFMHLNTDPTGHLNFDLFLIKIIFKSGRVKTSVQYMSCVPFQRLDTWKTNSMILEWK